MSEKIIESLNNVLSVVDKIDKETGGVRKLIREQIESVTISDEEIRRSTAKLKFDMELENQKKKEEYEREFQRVQDERRRAQETIDNNNKVRETALRTAEDEFLSILNASRDAENKVPTWKVIRTAYEKALADSRSQGFQQGASSVKVEYETAKAIYVSENSKDKALAEQKIVTLTEQVKQLTEQNNALLKEQMQNTERMKDLGTEAFRASAGLQSKAQEAMSNAVSSVSVPRK